MSNINYCLNIFINLIQTEAKEDRDYLIRLNIGVYIAVLLAQQYPKLVISLTISSYYGFSRIGQELLPRGIRFVSRLAAQGTTNTPLSLTKSRGIADILRLFSKEPLPIRTLIVVGLRLTALGKSSNNPKVAKALQRSLSSNQWVAVVKSGDHIGYRWNVDHPKGFAELILA